MTGCGWLAKNPALPAVNHGVRVPRWSAKEHAPFPTRTEEYWFVANALERTKRGFVVDAGSGFNPEIHVLDYILGNMLFDVYAIDQNAAALTMAYHPRIQRVVGDLLNIPLDNGAADAWVCVSTLEHMNEEKKRAALREARRVVRPGGAVILTADRQEPQYLQGLLREALFGCDDPTLSQGEMLSPPVAWAIGQ
jgi:ubiquinone/menaquinone biosynthesis C-methylase UbiE